jgi:hypothetical protein
MSSWLFIQTFFQLEILHHMWFKPHIQASPLNHDNLNKTSPFRTVATEKTNRFLESSTSSGPQPIYEIFSREKLWWQSRPPYKKWVLSGHRGSLSVLEWNELEKLLRVGEAGEKSFVVNTTRMRLDGDQHLDLETHDWSSFRCHSSICEVHFIPIRFGPFPPPFTMYGNPTNLRQ